MSEKREIILIRKIEQSILLIRKEKVIIDADLARFYGVPTKALNQAVKRNPDRFPPDFMFQLTPEEKSQVVTICDHLVNLKYSRHLPYAFTEHGAIMAASILNSPRAVEVSVFIVRAFIKLRQTLAEHKELSHKIKMLEIIVANHDLKILALVNAIKTLSSPKPIPSKRRIGFLPDDKE